MVSVTVDCAKLVFGQNISFSAMMEGGRGKKEREKQRGGRGDTHRENGKRKRRRSKGKKEEGKEEEEKRKEGRKEEILEFRSPGEAGHRLAELLRAMWGYAAQHSVFRRPTGYLQAGFPDGL